MMRIRFSEFAQRELVDACDWYEQQQLGFRSAVRDAAQRIGGAPLLFPLELGEVRRYVMPRFPYTLRYVLRGNEVWILAVSHQHRRPDYWVGDE